MPIHSRRVIKQDVWIERPDHSKLRLAIFRAKQVATKRPATGILWLHGGGYALETAENTLVYAEQLVVGGDSAGGGLTAAVCLRARDQGDVKIDW
ncbi:alpha/beta hydrolase [Limosilactobacillus fermentum]